MEVQKYKHVCKFCKKSFPCGRSLGGHIRSHLPKPGFELRENLKKTWRAVDHDDVLINNSSFSSSTETENLKIGKMNQCQDKRSTFARSNSYSSVSGEVEADKKELVVAMCLIMLSQDVGSWGVDITSPLVTPSENFPLSQGKNSKNLKRREEVVGKNSAFDAVNGKKYESARNGYVKKELKSKVSVVSASGFGSNDENSKNLESKRKREKHHVNITKLESSTCGFVKNGSKTQEFKVLRNGFGSDDESKHAPESKRKIGQITASGYVKKGSKLEEFEASKDELVSYIEDHNMLDTELYNDVSKASCYKRNKFECTTCNKVFHSYQALGGHRASHKKHVGGPRCSPPLSRLEENGMPSTVAPPSPNDRKHSQSKQEKEQEDVQVMRIIGPSSSSSSLTPSKKLVQKHECPICFRVFPSGQALGGHKRSHLLVGSNADSTGRISEVKINNSQQQQSSIVPPKTSNNQISKISEVVGKLETRDLLDLNFPPAPAQDETTISVTTTTSSKSTSLVGFMKPYWFVESSYKHEPLLDLISN